MPFIFMKQSHFKADLLTDLACYARINFKSVAPSVIQGRTQRKMVDSEGKSENKNP